MAESTISLTEGAGKKLHVYNRTIGANSVEDQVVLLGEHYLPTFAAHDNGVSFATTGDHIMAIMADSTNYVRIRRIRIRQSNPVAAAATVRFDVKRLSTAGTGGTVITPRPYDTADSAYGGVVRTLPSSKGTEGVLLFSLHMGAKASAPLDESNKAEWTDFGVSKPIIIAPGTSNGLCVRIDSGAASGQVAITIEFTVTPFL